MPLRACVGEYDGEVGFRRRRWRQARKCRMRVHRERVGTVHQVSGVIVTAECGAPGKVHAQTN